MSGFAEIHSHFLYGIDDGARTQEEMFAMIDRSHKNGITSLVATPHITPGIEPFSMALYEKRLAEAKGYCEYKGYDIHIHSGAEVLYNPMMNQLDLRKKIFPTLGGSQWVLVEFVPDVTMDELESALERFELSGYSVVIAHIERYSCMYSGNAYRLKDNHPLRYQVNCNTVLTKHGFFKDLAVRRWFKKGLIDHIASDAHNDKSRPIAIAKAYSVLAEEYGTDYAKKLCGCIENNSLIKRIENNYQTLNPVW